MSRSHGAELLFLLGLSTLPIACDDDGGGGEHRDEVDAAVDACLPFADRLATCYGGGAYESYYLAFVGSCVFELGRGDDDSPDCRAAQEDYFACVATMDCSDFKSEGPCSDESAAVDEQCDLDETSEASEDSGDSG